MQQIVGKLISQFREFYRSLPPLKRNAIILSTVIVLIGLGGVIIMATHTDYQPLFTNINSEQLPLIVEKLQKRGVPFSLDKDGTAVLIPEALLHATQMALMAELGDTRVGTSGLEIFAKQDLGTTSYAQKINYQRALQGELMRAINTVSAVRQSKVILALPAKKTFLEEGGEPSASVVLEMQPGQNLAPEQVRGITLLVASAVEGLRPEKVSVVDARGKILSKHHSPDSAMSAELMEMKRKVEADIEERIQTLLRPVIGAGKVIAKVDATLNPRQVSSVEETVDPDQTAVRSSQTEEELLDGARNNPVGVPGARANLPGAEEQGSVGFRQNVRREIKQTNFSVPKTVRTVKEAAGDLQRISVAVLVDGVYRTVTGEDGKESTEWVERAPAEMQKYDNIVKNAIGFNAARGDQVKIESIRFEKEDFGESEQLLSTLERKQLLRSLLKWSLLGFALALFFFIVVRPFMRWVTDSFHDSVEDLLPKTIEELESLQSADNSLPGMAGAMPMLEEAMDPNKAESELLKERIMSILNQDIEKSVAAMDLWLAKKE